VKRLYPIFLAILGLSLLILPACQPGQVSAALGQEFNLRLGQKAVITGEDFMLEFAAVQEDSRCPTGAT